MIIFPLDERRMLIVPGDAKITVEYAAIHWKDSCLSAVKNHDAFFVALSGGSTPKTIFQMLTRDPFKNEIPWKKVHLFWSDERSAPPDHPDSNYHMAMEAGLKDMPIPASHIHRMQAEEDIVKNAEKYEKTIHEVLQGRTFDLIMLGMGEDGHTASLFPQTLALTYEDRWVAANHIPQKDAWRMTMTYPCLNSAHTLAIYVIGSAKNAMLKNIIRGPYNPLEWPAQKVGSASHQALWIADEAAAQGLI